MITSAVNLSTVPRPAAPAAHRSARSVMISRNRSAPTAAAMSIECTTSANRTVTCLYSADRVVCVSGAPHSLQNLAVACGCAPQEPQNSAVAVSPPPPSPLGSTSISFHCWSTMSAISLCHVRHGFLTLICRLIRDPVQFCSGLVDLVVRIGRHGGGGHCLALAGERFVGLMAEHIAKVS